MSIGAPEKDEIFEVGATKRAGYAVKKTANFLWQDPIRNIFIFSLMACIVGLLINRHFPFEFYVILGILSIVEAYKYFAKQSMILPEIKGEKNGT